MGFDRIFTKSSKVVDSGSANNRPSGGFGSRPSTTIRPKTPSSFNRWHGGKPSITNSRSNLSKDPRANSRPTHQLMTVEALNPREGSSGGRFINGGTERVTLNRDPRAYNRLANPSSPGSDLPLNHRGGQIMFYAGFLYRRFGTRHLNELTEQQRRSLGLR